MKKKKNEQTKNRWNERKWVSTSQPASAFRVSFIEPETNEKKLRRWRPSGVITHATLSHANRLSFINIRLVLTGRAQSDGVTYSFAFYRFDHRSIGLRFGASWAFKHHWRCCQFKFACHCSKITVSIIFESSMDYGVKRAIAPSQSR